MRLKPVSIESQPNLRRKRDMQAILNQNFIAEKTNSRTDGAFGKKIGLFTKLFGCWHKRLTRPFTNDNGSYRACLNCGARKKFDAENFRTFGAFHYPPSISARDN